LLAQNCYPINANGDAPESSAMLDGCPLKRNVIPRLTTSQKNAISVPANWINDLFQKGQYLGAFYFNAGIQQLLLGFKITISC